MLKQMSDIALQNRLTVLNERLVEYRALWRAASPGYKLVIEQAAKVVKDEIESIEKRCEKNKLAKQQEAML